MLKLTKTQRKAIRRLKKEQKNWRMEESMQSGAAKILGLISSYKNRAVVMFKEDSGDSVLYLVNKFTGCWHCVLEEEEQERKERCINDLNNGGGVKPYATNDIMKQIFNSHSYKSGLHSWA